jgi:hypothetical protein
VTAAVPEIGGDLRHSLAASGQGRLSMRQQQGKRGPIRWIAWVAWKGGLDDRGGGPLPRRGQLLGHLGDRDRLYQPVHRRRPADGRADQRMLAQRRDRVAGRQAPRANAICERWIASARRECTDRMLIAGRRHLHHILSEYADHYNTRRPHRALSQQPPDGKIPVAPADDNIRVRRRARLGGLIHEHSQVA